MSRLAALAAVLLCVRASGARETATLEVPKTSPIVPIATPNLGLSLDPVGLSPANVPLQVRTASLKPVASVVPIKQVEPLAPSAIPVQQHVMPAVQHPMLAGEETGNGPQEPQEPLEEGLAKAQAFFDGRAAKLGGLPLVAAGLPEAKAFRAALDAAKASQWRTEKLELAVFAAEKLYAQLGVKTERVVDEERGLGLRVVTESGHSELNDLAADAFARLGVRSDYFPGATKGASAMFDGKNNRIFMGAPDRPDFYLGYLHEVRHAWYTSLLRKGVLRLFHLQFLARAGLAVAPGAEAYFGYVSLEELSNYPKTLKHLIVELKRSKGQTRRVLAESAYTRVWHMIELLKTGAYLSELITRVDAHVGLTPSRFSEEERAKTALVAAETVDHFQLETPRGWFFIPSPRREGRNFLGRRTYKGSEREASDRLRLAADLIGKLTLDMAPWVIEYKDAVSAEDWDKASRAADKMTVLVAKAEKDWDAREPQK